MTNDDAIISAYYAAANPTKAGPMAAYMKDQFPYLGLQKPQRAELSREFLKAKKAEIGVDDAFIDRCFALPEREFAYLALSYLDTVKARLKPKDIPLLERLAQTRPWWDTVDSIAPIAGDLLLRFPEAREETAARWMAHDSLWLRRVSIIFQLKYKSQTDTGLLARAIEANCGTNEFFLNKAIGWALREYSKTDAAWVRAFIASHRLHPLSVREGSKYV
jgi:3-methyladenine DNA glycosylase AlkD